MIRIFWIELQIMGRMIKLFFILSILLSNISLANANSTKYVCSGDANYLYIIFDTEKKTVIAGDSNPHKYLKQTDFLYWHSTVSIQNVTLVRSFIFHKPTGKMSVKSDNLITSGEKMYFYECAINQ